MLRLHKYAPIFAHMSYEEMLNLTEVNLESLNITKGARQKLILSIQKLKARSAVLFGSECELHTADRRMYRMDTTYTMLIQVLLQVRAFLSTPIRPQHTLEESSVTSTISASLSSSSSLSDHSSSSSSPRSFVSPTFLFPLSVDVNNNNSSQPNYHAPHNAGALFDTKELLRCWSSLGNDHLADIITRLIGHG